MPAREGGLFVYRCIIHLPCSRKDFLRLKEAMPVYPDYVYPNEPPFYPPAFPDEAEV